MITDLKADSERWEAERRTSDKRSRPSIGISVLDSDDITQQFNHLIGEYRGSITHQSRQNYGPTEVAPGSPTSLGYAMPSTSQSTNPYFPGTDNFPTFRSESERPLISFKQVLIIHSKSTILISQNHQYPLDNIPHQAYRHTTAVSPNPNLSF